MVRDRVDVLSHLHTKDDQFLLLGSHVEDRASPVHVTGGDYLQFGNSIRLKNGPGRGAVEELEFDSAS